MAKTNTSLKDTQETKVIVPDRGPFAGREVTVVEKPESVPEPLVPFDRWFAAKGFNDRWKSGMIAYTDVSPRRTMSEWNEIFKNY